MAIARSTGALSGTSETSGRAIAANGSKVEDQVDLLADATSKGTLYLYALFTTPSTVDGIVEFQLHRHRVTGQKYLDRSWQVPARRSGEKVYLGEVPASRFMSAVVKNKTTVDITGVALLYELVKES